MESIVLGDRDYGLHSPLTVLKDPVHFAPAIPGDVRAISSTVESIESMMRSARSSSVDCRTGDHILKPRVFKQSEGRQREKCFEMRREGEEESQKEMRC